MSNASDFVIENGVLKKYVGPGGDVVIPAGVTEIGDNAFRACSTLVSVTVPEGVTAMGKMVFKDCTALKDIHIPEGLISLGNRCFEGCSALGGIILPNSLSSTGIYVFADCSSLSDVVVSKGLSSIEKRMFSRCESLKTITLPDSVETIGDYAFFDCSELTDIVLSKNLRTIGIEAFYFCKALKNIRLPEGLRLLERGVFQYSGLRSAVVPKSVTYIGDCVFQTRNDIRITILGTAYLGKDCIESAFLAAQMPLKDISAPKLKQLAVLGWLLSTGDDPAVEDAAAKSFRKYWETHLDVYLDQIKQDDRFLPLLVTKQLLTLDQTDKLLEVFRDNVEATAMLLDHKNSRFNEKTVEANEQKKVAKELKGPSEASMIRKNWTSKPLPDGTVQVNSYKGEDTEVRVPERIGNKVVARIGDFCFDPSADCANLSMKVPNKETRYNMSSVTIPGSVKEIGVHAFDGCWGLKQITLNEGLLMIREMYIFRRICRLQQLKGYPYPVS